MQSKFLDWSTSINPFLVCFRKIILTLKDEFIQNQFQAFHCIFKWDRIKSLQNTRFLLSHPEVSMKIHIAKQLVKFKTSSDYNY
jgi:hypothetical protein